MRSGTRESGRWSSAAPREWVRRSPSRDGTPGIERINFIGHRHLIDRLLAGDMLSHGSAIGMISSFAGVGWPANLELLQEFLDIDDFEEATRWAQERDKA